MAEALTIRIEGVEQLLKRLDQLPNKLQKRQMRKALNFATTPILKEAKRRVPVRTGQLKRSLGRRTRTYRRSGNIIVVIGPRRGFKNPETGDNPTRYAHLVELGTRLSAANPFLRPALQTQNKAAQARFRQKLRQGIEEEVKKLGSS